MLPVPIRGVEITQLRFDAERPGDDRSRPQVVDVEREAAEVALLPELASDLPEPATTPLPIVRVEDIDILDVWDLFDPFEQISSPEFMKQQLREPLTS